MYVILNLWVMDGKGPEIFIFNLQLLYMYKVITLNQKNLITTREIVTALKKFGNVRANAYKSACKKSG